MLEAKLPKITIYKGSKRAKLHILYKTSFIMYTIKN